MPEADPLDVAFARVCLTQRRVTRAQVEECLAEQRRLAAAGRRVTLAQVLIQRGHVTAADYTKLLARLRAGEAPPPPGTDRYGLPAALGQEPAAEAPRVSASGRYEPADGESTRLMDGPPLPLPDDEPDLALPPDEEAEAEPEPEPDLGEPTLAMSEKFVMDLPTADAPADFEVVDDDAAPPADLRIRQALGVPEKAREFDFGAYHVFGLLGAGAMGAVYKAQSLETGDKVALKALLRGADTTDVQLRKFVLEAQTAQALDHPRIIRIHDIGIQEDVAYFAMELVPGQDLQAHIGKRTFAPRALLELMAEVADAVQHAHEHGVVHRDLKPANIIVREPDRTPVLTDFGLAWSVSGSGIQSSARTRVGTPLFMSPEQVREEEVDGRCDIWALGVILFYGLTGRPPFWGKGPDALFAAIVAGQVAPTGAGPEVDAVVRRALAVDRSERYPTASALASDLRRAAERARPAPGTAPPSAGRRWLVPLAVVAALVAVVLVALLLAR